MESFHDTMMEEAANAARGGALGLSGHYRVYAGLVFIHESCQFEAWLFGVNKQVQKQYWQRIKDSGWNQYPLVATTRGEDAILTHVLTANPDFDDLDAVTEQIENGAVKSIKDVETFLKAYPA